MAAADPVPEAGSPPAARLLIGRQRLLHQHCIFGICLANEVEHALLHGSISLWQANGNRSSKPSLLVVRKYPKEVTCLLKTIFFILAIRHNPCMLICLIKRPQEMSVDRWAAVPSTTNFSEFSHSLGRLQPITISLKQTFERPLSVAVLRNSTASMATLG